MAQRTKMVNHELGNFEVIMWINVNCNSDNDPPVTFGYPQVQFRSQDTVIRGKTHHVDATFRFIDNEWTLYECRVATKSKDYSSIYLFDNNASDASRRLVKQFMQEQVNRTPMGLFDVMRKEALQECVDSCVSELADNKREFEKRAAMINNRMSILCNLLSKES